MRGSPELRYLLPLGTQLTKMPEQEAERLPKEALLVRRGASRTQEPKQLPPWREGHGDRKPQCCVVLSHRKGSALFQQAEQRESHTRWHHQLGESCRNWFSSPVSLAQKSTILSHLLDYM